MRILKPDLYLPSILDIDLEKLKSIGIRGMIVDIDNTLVPHNYPSPKDENESFFESLKKLDIKACLVTNNSQKRVEKFNTQLGLPYVYRAKKPLKVGYKKAMKIMGTTKENTACIGDQVFADVWGGHRAGIYTILVKPISGDGEGPFLRFKRMIEKKIIRGEWINESNQRKT